MAKKSSSKKTISAVATPLGNLAALLRQTADEIERLAPIVDMPSMQPGLADLTTSLNTWRNQLQGSLLLPEDEFASLQPSWAECWQLAKADLIRAVAEVVGESASKIQKPERDVEYRHRLLMTVLQRSGSGVVNGLISSAKSKWQQKQAAQAAVSHVSDREANEYLKAWGKLSEQDFVAASKTLDQNLIKRAGEMVGLKINKATPASMKNLHKKAHRFAVNTGA